MGPTQGRPRRLGMIAASVDGVALDAVTQSAMGFGPEEEAPTVAAANVKLGSRQLAEIALSGAELSELVQHIKRSPVVRMELLGPFVKLVRGLVTARPHVDPKLCKSCGACAGICPGKAIAIEDYAQVDCNQCVECFCCLEACPFDAITVKRSPMYSVAQKVQRLISRKA
jgi:ferredoxin